MLYPSHFNNNIDGNANPETRPIFHKRRMQNFREQAGKRDTAVASGIRMAGLNYNARYILEQIRGSNDAMAAGYLFWNAGNATIRSSTRSKP
jgi:hypothetical protein